VIAYLRHLCPRTFKVALIPADLPPVGVLFRTHSKRLFTSGENRAISDVAIFFTPNDFWATLLGRTGYTLGFAAHFQE